jgi:hypothetical protein
VDVEIISWLDDHSRYTLNVSAHRRITGAIVLASFREAVAVHVIPASTLTDNCMVFTTGTPAAAAAATAWSPSYAA